MGKVDSFEFIENGDRRLANISLVKIWKGNRSAVGEIYTGANVAVCGYDFQVGETYVIYAYKGEAGRLVAGLCERTAPVDAAVEDLKYLQSLSYYPLSIRNAWTFTQKVTQTRYQENITDSLRLTGKLYYRFRFRFDGADNDWDEWYAPGAGPVNRLYHGIALFEYPLTSAVIDGEPLPTSVSDQPYDRPVRTFDLAPNYPNPFVSISNNTFAIRYHLAKAAAVTLRIYDVLGREIRTLVERREPAGERLERWDGIDARGNKVPSGIYFYRLQVGKQVEVRKLVLTE